jgi:hypothetical protein
MSLIKTLQDTQKELDEDIKGGYWNNNLSLYFKDSSERSNSKQIALLKALISQKINRERRIELSEMSREMRNLRDKNSHIKKVTTFFQTNFEDILAICDHGDYRNDALVPGLFSKNCNRNKKNFKLLKISVVTEDNQIVSIKGYLKKGRYLSIDKDTTLQFYASFDYLCTKFLEFSKSYRWEETIHSRYYVLSRNFFTNKKIIEDMEIDAYEMIAHKVHSDIKEEIRGNLTARQFSL